MRKHLYLITDHPDKEQIGSVEVREKPYIAAEKNDERTINHRDIETDKTHTEEVVGLGYANFDNEMEYNSQIFDVIQDKLREIDERHLQKAGLGEL